MNDSTVTSAQGGVARSPRWLVLFHQIPPKPDYFRVKVRRRLQRIGAAALKNSVYVLPLRDETLEDFEWLAREIRQEGGEATLFRGEFLTGTTDEEVRTMFQADRTADYAAIADEARALAGGGRSDDADRLRRRLDETERIDFFNAPGRAAAEAALSAAGPSGEPAGRPGAAPRPSAGIWVTRTGIKVDRISSAWLIRRFIDPAARFKFVPAKGYRPEPGELRFDMYQGEFTHEGDHCTFETLLAHFGLDDPALHALAEIIHDVDLKDGKFGRAEAAGIAALIDGLVVAYPEDGERLERGAAVFEGMYAYIAAGARARPVE